MAAARIGLAKLSGALSRRFGRGGGTTLPGKVLTALDKKAIEHLAAGLERGSVVLSATNGKTTTASMIAAILHDAGIHPVHNREGANLASGVATALIASSSLGGQIGGDLGLFEVDEAAMPRVVGELSPRVLVLANLFRDQLDRYGELEHLAKLWSEVIGELRADCRVVLCADDPLVASLGLNPDGKRRAGVTYFGLDDPSQGLPGLQHAADSKYCLQCGEGRSGGCAYKYRSVYLGHLGDYVCPECGSARPHLDVAAKRVRLIGMSGAEVEVRVDPCRDGDGSGGTRDKEASDGARTGDDVRFKMTVPLPGLYNVYNSLAAVACCVQLGLGVEQIQSGIERSAAVFGRVEKVKVGKHPVSIVLIKNPTGANEVLRTLMLEESEYLNLLFVLNDKIADGRDISWIWDVDFDLLAGRVRSAVCSGTRADEMALRLKYAGLSSESLTVEPRLDRALDTAVQSTRNSPLYALPTYTALLSLRGLLAKRGHARQFWEHEGDERRHKENGQARGLDDGSGR